MIGGPSREAPPSREFRLTTVVGRRKRLPLALAAETRYVGQFNHRGTVPIIHDFTASVGRLVWVNGKRAYHSRNSLVAAGGTAAAAVERGLYLYLYANEGHREPIRNKNGRPGVVICPSGHHCLKSGMFQHGLHEHIRRNVHGHLWRPEATPVEDYIAPAVMRWFLVFETEPTAPAPNTATQRTREKFYNSIVRDWLRGLNLAEPRQPATLEHRWIPPNNGSPPITMTSATQFLQCLLATHPTW